jgi:hypothetical protein
MASSAVAAPMNSIRSESPRIVVQAPPFQHPLENVRARHGANAPPLSNAQVTLSSTSSSRSSSSPSDMKGHHTDIEPPRRQMITRNSPSPDRSHPHDIYMSSESPSRRDPHRHERNHCHSSYRPSHSKGSPHSSAYYPGKRYSPMSSHRLFDGQNRRDSTTNSDTQVSCCCMLECPDISCPDVSCPDVSCPDLGLIDCGDSDS